MTIVTESKKDAATDYYNRLKAAKVAALWTIPGTLAAEPTLDEDPYVWHAKDIFPLLREAVGVVDLGEETDRRALNAFNPKRPFGVSQNLVAGYQLVLPGETAPAHRHTPSAIRLLLHGSGHTTVEGEPVLMERGDLVLTPPVTWHDHRHTGTEPMIWLDGLDVPFVRGQHAQFAEEYANNELQELTEPEDVGVDRYPVAGMIPAERKWTKLHSPKNKYPYSEARPALSRFHASEGSPSTGSTLEYVNPLTGGPVIPTMANFLTLLPSGAKSRAYRHTPSRLYCVLEGHGHSIINGRRYDWEADDFFVIPSWHWYQHFADSAEDVVLFSFSDRPIYEPFGLLREESADDAPVLA